MANLDLSKQVNALLLEYGDAVNEAVQDVLPDVAKETVEMLKATSPSKSGKYAQGWASEKWKNSKDYTGVTVYNKTRGYLTHLLEFGHAKQNGGRTKASPHIATAEEYAQNRLIDQVSAKIRGIQ